MTNRRLTTQDVKTNPIKRIEILTEAYIKAYYRKRGYNIE